MNLGYATVASQAILLCFWAHESRTVVMLFTAVAMLRQLVMFVVDKVVEEDHHPLLSSNRCVFLYHYH